MCRSGGIRCKGGVSSSWAWVGNRRTCRLDTGNQSEVQIPVLLGYQEGELQVANTTRGRVPMRGTGTGQPVVVMKVL